MPPSCSLVPFVVKILEFFLSLRLCVRQFFVSNIARGARYKPFGPHTFCWCKTTDLEFRICCRSEAEASVPGVTGEGHKPAGRCKNLFAFNIVHSARWMVSIMSFVEWASACGLATRFWSWIEEEPRKAQKFEKRVLPHSPFHPL